MSASLGFGLKVADFISRYNSVLGFWYGNIWDTGELQIEGTRA